MHRKFILLTVISMVFLLSACSFKSINNNTLENYSRKHKNINSEIHNILKTSGLEEQFSIKNNTIITTIDMTESLKGIKLTKELVKNLKSSFKDSLSYIEKDMSKKIKELEKETNIKNICIQVNVNIDKKKDSDIIYTKKFFSNINK